MIDITALAAALPFAAPLGNDASFWWHFPIMVLLVNLVYSATRYDDPKQILQHAAKGIVYILTFLGGVFGVLYLLANYA